MVAAAATLLNITLFALTGQIALLWFGIVCALLTAVTLIEPR
jgi:hypothetical protein